MFVAWSSQPPPRYEVIREDGDDMCTVVFYTDVRTVPTPDGDTAYRAKCIVLTVRYTDGILADIRDNYSEWLAMAVEDHRNAEEGDDREWEQSLTLL